jgi:phosphopantothenoylcysteine decarboxylase/phosphopantothenate--cysteine ligase
LTVRVLAGRRILLGVTGSISAYKSAAVASILTRAGAGVDAVLTPSAQKFVGLATFSGLTGRRAYGDIGAMTDEGSIAHVELGLAADAALVAPATAESLSQIAAGRASNILTAALLSVRGPILLAPAMEANMLSSPPVSEALASLTAAGKQVLEPAVGRHASGRRGRGRLPEAEELVDHLRRALGADGGLRGRRVVVTAGATREAIDAVRFLSNPSTGTQGTALAEAARDRGAKVTLIGAHLRTRIPAGVEYVTAGEAEDMAAAVAQHTAGADALVMCAAVGDFRPRERFHGKLRRQEGLRIDLEPTPDIVKSACRARVRIGFSLSFGDPAGNARQKIEQKSLDAIVANDLADKDAGFGFGANTVTVFSREGVWDRIGPAPKPEVAERVVDLLEELLD